MRKAKKWMTLFLALLLLIQPATVQAEDESIEDVLNKPSEYTYVDLVLQTWKKGDFPLAFNTAQDIIAVLAELSSRAPETVDAYLNAVLEANDIPTQVNIRLPNGKTSSKRLNMELLKKRLLFVYGTPQDVSQVTPNDKKIDENGQEQYRYLGFDASGNPYINLDFPEDELGTTNVGQRKWLEKPWERPNEIHSNVKPRRTDYMDLYDRDTKAEWLDRIQDKYTGDGKSRGNWDPNWPGDKLVDYAMIQQPPTQLAPGQVTLWHRRYDGTGCTEGPDYTQGGKKVCFKDWYDSFYLAPYDEWLAGLFAQFWDDLSVRARWYDPPSGVTWPNEGKEQPPGTPLVLQAQVRVDMPRLYDPTLQQIAELFMEDNVQFFYFPVNEGEIDAGTSLAKVNAWVIFATPQGNGIEIIGTKKVELVHGQTKLVNMEWKFPEKDTEVYVIVIPKLEGKNANFLEFNLANNLMSMVVRVDEGGTPPPQFEEVEGDGLDNIKINAFIPHPGNGGKKPGEQIDYRTVVQAELPTQYIRVSFNGGTQSNPIPLYPEVVSRLNEIGSWSYVSVSSSGNVSASPQISYLATCYNPETEETYTCTQWMTNPNYSRARDAVNALAAQWNNIQATVTVQGKTCTVTLVRGGPEQSCVISGVMPNTESFVISSVQGSGIRETRYDDNQARVMMYPILTKESDATNSTGTTEYHQLDPKTGAPTKNTQTEPAKYGQQVRITISSTPNLEHMETKFGYPLFRMNTEYANIRYGTGRLRYVPQGGTFEVSGNTPSATYNGISKQATNNKTWNNDFENIAKGGSDIKYLYDVERTQRSYGSWTWYEYETFWANCSDCKDLNGNTKPLVRAEVETSWRTKKDHHWIVDLVKTDDSPIGYWPQYGTLPPLKDGVPTPLSQGGKPQTVKPVFTYKYNDKTRGVITKQINDAPNIHMFGTLVTSIGGGS